MTDEELAAGWVTDNTGFNPKEPLGKIAIRTFLGGLKAGRPQWHDLRKDQNDLPKEDCEIITLHENGNKNIQKWKNGNWTNAIVIPVIAWCEITTFTDKE